MKTFLLQNKPIKNEIFYLTLLEIEIIDRLESFGFSKNATKILLSLLKFKILPLSLIAKERGLHYSRLYDPLTHLINQGFVWREAIKRGRHYKIVPNFFEVLRDDIKKKNDLTKSLETEIIKLNNYRDDETPHFFGFSSKKKTITLIYDIIERAKKKLFFIIPSEYLYNNSLVRSSDHLFEKLWKKKMEFNDISIILAIEEELFQKIIFRKNCSILLNFSIPLYSISNPNENSFGLLVTEKDYLMMPLKFIMDMV
jgi:sugar-specific transcriptional regulator TrmB